MDVEMSTDKMMPFDFTLVFYHYTFLLLPKILRPQFIIVRREVCLLPLSMKEKFPSSRQEKERDHSIDEEAEGASFS